MDDGIKSGVSAVLLKEPRGYSAARMVLEERVSLREAAQRYGISHEAVRQILKKLGHVGELPEVRARRIESMRGPRPAYQRAAIARKVREVCERHRSHMGIDLPQILHLHYERGWSFKMVADHLGLTRSQVAGYVFRNRPEVRSETDAQKDTA